MNPWLWAVTEMVGHPHHSGPFDDISDPFQLGSPPGLRLSDVEFQGFETGVNQGAISPHVRGPLRGIIRARRQDAHNSLCDGELSHGAVSRLEGV